MENINHIGSPQNIGVAAPTTIPPVKPFVTDFNNNSAQNQRLKLLDWLFEKGSISTAEAREHLDIMSPAPRIMELRKAGYLIETISDDWTSDHGINHKGIARYYLVQNVPVEHVSASGVMQ